MIHTGVERIDGLFGAGIPDGILVDVFGPSGAGKTQLALQAAAHTVSAGGRALFQDTTGEFRPERMLEMIRENGLDPAVLDRVSVSRLTNVAEQTRSVPRAGAGAGGPSIVVIDNVSDLFSFEYYKEDQFVERSRIFLRYMRALSEFSVGSGTTVLLTNVVRNVNGRQVEHLGRAVDLFAHVKVRLGGEGGRRRCACYSAFAGASFGFEIGPPGIRSVAAD